MRRTGRRSVRVGSSAHSPSQARERPSPLQCVHPIELVLSTGSGPSQLPHGRRSQSLRATNLPCEGTHDSRHLSGRLAAHRSRGLSDSFWPTAEVPRIGAIDPERSSEPFPRAVSEARKADVRAAALPPPLSPPNVSESVSHRCIRYLHESFKRPIQLLDHENCTRE